MSSQEPEPDDEDTGPLHVGTSFDRPAERRFDAPLSVNPKLVRHDNHPALVAGAATVAVVALGALAWTFWPAAGRDEDPAGAAVTSTSSAAQEGEARLRAMLPAGYPADACETVVPAKDAVAQLQCTANNDPGGPLTATYTLAESSGSLTTLFDDVVSTSSVVDCPGNIQSPGPWRRNASPNTVAGTLVCGFARSRPTVAWTTEESRLVSEVQSGPQGPNLAQLYSWWSNHS